MVEKLELLMKKAGTGVQDRKCVAAANTNAEVTGEPASAIELADGSVVTGKTSELMGATSAMLLNALKKLAGLPDELRLISPSVIEPIQQLKIKHLGNHNPNLHIAEMLIALTICAGTDENAAKVVAKLDELKGCEAHSSVILSSEDQRTLAKLGINLTCEPKYQTKKLFHN